MLKILPKKKDKEIIKQPCYHFIYIWDDEHHYGKSNCLGGMKVRNPSFVWGERKPTQGKIEWVWDNSFFQLIETKVILLSSHFYSFISKLYKLMH